MFVIILIISIIIFMIILILSLSMRMKLHMEWKQSLFSIHYNVHIAGIKLIDREQEIDIEGIAGSDINELIDMITSFFDQSHRKIEPHVKLYQKKHRLKNIVKKRLKKVLLHSFKWKTTIGTKEAASTGVITGVCWTIKGIVGAFLTQYLRFEDTPEFDVTPVYHNSLIDSQCTCIFSMRLGQAIYTMMQIGKWNRRLTN